MSWLLPSVVVTLTVASVLVLMFLLLVLAERQRYLIIWLAAWIAYFLRIVSQLMILLYGAYDLFWFGNQFCAILSGLLLLWGTHQFSRRRIPAAWIASSILCLIFLIVVLAFDLSFFLLAFPGYLYVGIAYVWTGRVLLTHNEFSQLARKVAGWGFIICGIHMLNYPLIRPLDWLIPWGYLFSAMLHMVMAMGLLQCYFERIWRELANSEQRYRKIIEDQTEFVIRKLPDGTITFVNDAYCNWRGMQREDLLGKSVFALLPNEVRQELKERIASLTPEKPVDHWEFLGKGPKGNDCWLNWTDRGLFDEEGNLLEVQSVGRDIDELKRANQQMLQLATAIEQSAEAVFIAEIRGGSRAEIVYVNPAFEKMYLYDKEEVIGKDFNSIIDNVASGKETRSQIEETLRKGESWYGQVKNSRKDGTVFFKDTVVSPFRDEDGDMVGFVSIGRDVTREIELERQLIQSQKMEVVGRLAGGVAHDFNNLLAVIISYAEECKDSVPENSPLWDNLEGIIKTVDSAALLTRQLLTFSRTREMKVDRVDLNQVIDDMQNILRPLVGKAIELNIDLDGDLECIEADKSQIEQVVLNLVVNARDAVGEYGTIELRTASLPGEESDGTGGGTETPNKVLLEIADNGAGIAPEIARRIFEPFFTTKGMDKGTGLGLSTVQNIVTKHGGTISVESAPGQGSCFRIEFPACGGNE